MSVVPSPVGASRRRAALVTPEAVTIDLPLADRGARSLAILVDLIILFTLQYAVVLAAVLAVGVGFGLGLDGGPGWLAIVAFLLLNFAILWGVPVACEVLLRVRTVLAARPQVRRDYPSPSTGGPSGSATPRSGGCLRWSTSTCCWASRRS